MTDGPELRVERRIDAPPAAVFRYLTDSVRWASWQGVSAEIDAVPGGVFQVVMPNGAFVEGRFVEVVPDRHVVFTWGWRGSPSVPPGSSTVDIELVADGDATIVRLTHRGLPAEDVPIHRLGWDRYLPRLALAAANGDPGPDTL
jgi:uncharacterized protein YndB with AHSA1/START domain